MEGGSSVSRSIIDELHAGDIEDDQTELESAVTRSITDEIRFSNHQGDQMEGESGVTRSIIDEIHSLDIPRRSKGR